MGKGRRIEYIDAMRGLTMILVVYSHICHFCLGDSLLGFNRIFFLFRNGRLRYHFHKFGFGDNPDPEFFSFLHLFRARFLSRKYAGGRPCRSL